MIKNNIEIPLKEARVGAELAVDIYNLDGSRLLGAGNVLTEELLEKLDNIGIQTITVISEDS